MKTMKEEVAGVDALPPRHGAGDAKMHGNRGQTNVDASGVGGPCNLSLLPPGRSRRRLPRCLQCRAAVYTPITASTHHSRD